MIREIDVASKFLMATNGMEPLPVPSLDPFTDFVDHNSALDRVHTQLTAKALQKVAARHVDVTLSGEPYRKEEFFSVWQVQEDVTAPVADLFSPSVNPNSYTRSVAAGMNSEKAHSRLNSVMQRLTSHPTLEEVREDMVSNASLLDGSVASGVAFVGSHETYLSYYDMVSNVATLFTDLSVSQLQFLSDFSSWDGRAVLFLLLRHLTGKIGRIVYPALMVMLYTPYDFHQFIDNVVLSAKTLIYRSFADFPILQTSLQRVWGGEDGYPNNHTRWYAVNRADREAAAAAREAAAAAREAAAAAREAAAAAARAAAWGRDW